MVTAVLGVIGFVTQGIVLSFNFARKLSEVEIAIRRDLQEHVDTDNDEFANIREEIQKEASSARSQFGETVSAIRTKVNEVELFGRDTFLRKESFNTAFDRFAQQMTTAFDRVEHRMARIEERLLKPRGE